MPRTTDGTNYFGVAAQVLPVLLLALAIDAWLFGVRIRRNEQDENDDSRHYGAGTFELWRQWLSFLTVVLLVAAEMHALWTVVDGGPRGNMKAVARERWARVGLHDSCGSSPSLESARLA